MGIITVDPLYLNMNSDVGGYMKTVQSEGSPFMANPKTVSIELTSYIYIYIYIWIPILQLLH